MRVLTDEQNFVLGLLRQSMGLESEALPAASLDMHAVADGIRRNGILLTVFPTLQDDSQVRQMLQMEYYAAVAQSINQGYEGARILDALDDAGLRCIGLKGWELRELYPHDAMRQMADLDFLVRPYDYTAICAQMESLGFAADGGESSWKHDNFHKGIITVEMHKRLTDDSDRIQDWERCMWERALCDHGNVYRMSDADYFAFHIVHMHKDFLNGCLGLRRIVDTWLLDGHLSEEDLRGAEAELQEMGLATFCQRMMHLGRVCMGQAPLDDDSEFLLRHAFMYGVFGTSNSYKAGRIVSMSHGGLASGKVWSALAAVFLPYDRMKAQFPILESWPILLPWCWGRRILRFWRSGNLKQYGRMLDYGDLHEEDFNEMKRFLAAGGCCG